jgi:N-acetylneuraminate lyase
MEEKFRGIFPALVTPFRKDGKINDKALQQIVKMNLDKGVTGFYVGGSTGEAFMLTVDERKYILEVVAQEAKGKCTLISHIGCISTEQTIELGKHAAQVGVDAISAIPPFYYKFSMPEIVTHYHGIVDEIDLPMIVYNFPAASGVAMSEAVFGELLGHERIIGIKHTSYDLYQLQRLMQLHPGAIVFNGHDEVFLAGLSMGANSAIGSTYNFMAEKFISIQKLFADGKQEEAHRLQSEANEIIAVLIRIGVFQGIKAALEMLGVDCGDCRKPFRSLSREDKEELRMALKL